ncbi:concanavalin A-like lectin/glucanase [Fistulina hepatica ATCC 64428]|uniref:Concanavalin A-like lectin/glucanase n=1 Tax=Fistulina hepatica ATCC 64428 TaxID=1128425 RepID=A0A0D7A075_9AGAR|nr:concanavalin A-like lectin/glucanase [Fistulina hepatica ATCC 64428]
MPPPRPPTVFSVSTPKHERFRSTMLPEGYSPDKSWQKTRDPFSRIAYLVTYAVAFLGIVGGAIQCYFGYRNVPMMTGNLCPVLDESFDSEDGVFGPNGTFFREVDLSGFGTGEFDMATTSSNNSFVRDGHLYIMPTLTEDVIGSSAVLNGYIYNVSDCTYNITHGSSYTSSSESTSDDANEAQSSTFNEEAYLRACSAVSNTTAGTVINPVQSARLTTRYSAKIRYGKVEVRAKIPRGDWLWPAIWMLPTDSVYGSWPTSGEIDLMEARGNGPSYPAQGINYVRGALNWGPLTWLNSVWRTYGWWTERRSNYSDDFHTYTLEWDEEFIRISVDTRLHHLLVVKIDESFWNLGAYPAVVKNGSDTIALNNPWVNGTKAAPFDQDFYLILNVAVGGTTGWFPDGDGNKPWLDGSSTAMRDFTLAQDKWYGTWPQSDDRAMIVDSVKMWQQC